MDAGSRVLVGRYEVGELIGRGGMAEVHIGHDRRLGRTVAIKILRSDLVRDPTFQARFRREAQAAASLNHPSIVAVYDTGEDVVVDANGVDSRVPFIVMEYVEGHTVRDILRDGSAVPIEEAVEITVGVLSALEYSHRAGIVHRDIKPANVMLTPAGAVKVMDFGIARAVADSAATMTQSQAVIGTAQYLSPEQARGETVDIRSDLYSTGCLLFELLTGRPPFTGDSPVAVAYQHVREAAPLPSAIASDVPEVLDRIVAKALTKDREGRYQSAAEFRADLEASLRGGHVIAPALGAAAVGAAATTQRLGAPATPATQVMDSPAWAPALPPGTPPGPAPATVDEPTGRDLRWLWWTLGILAVLAAAAIAILLLRGSGDQTVMVTVPDVAGRTEVEARDILTAPDLALQVRRQEEASTDVPKGNATRTDPPATTSVVKGSAIDLWVSSGPATTQVPDVTGDDQATARQRIEGAGLTVAPTIQQENSPDQQEGRITRTDPPATTAVAKGTPVTLYVATGNVDLENLVGKSQDEATARLSQLKLNSRIIEQESADAAPGTVTAQDRTGLVPLGTTVQLTVAKAPTTATIPTDLVGKDEAAATAALQALGLTPNVVYADSKEKPGTVISTNPTGGSTVQKGTTVTVTVATPANPAGGTGGTGG